MGLYGLKEIFQLAKQLEENGQLYYEIAAAKCNDPNVSSLCSKIAKQEVKHLEKVKSMEQLLLADEQMKRLTWEELTWLQLELEEGILFDFQELSHFIKTATTTEILARAIQMESDSITFYSNLMSEVDPTYKGLLEEFVNEENQHIEWLTSTKANLVK
ncbi:MAG: ferritin family protein [Planctomycetota bacterium]|jgi:rubrerythrin